MIITALTPIFAIILVGFGLSRLPTSTRAGWAEIERLTYYLFFPSLLILRLCESNFRWDEISELGLVIGLGLLAVTLLIVGLREFIAKDLSSMSSIYQGSIRFNTYIGLATIDLLFGDRGLTTAALCLAVYIPLVNILSVISLSLQGETGAKRIYMMMGSVLSNPLVVACAIGCTISYNNFAIPALLESLLEILSQPALPLGLLAVGAGIRFISIGEQSWQLVVASLNKLVVFPTIILLCCKLLDLNSHTATVLVLLTALPAPPSAYILARQLGGNESLMANIITCQTLAAFFMIPVWIEMTQRFL
ncbi:MAG: malonate transporter [Pseudohongiellaceae bacterium]|jgi:malonate transporter